MLSSSAGFTLQSTMRILLVEDDADVARFIGKGLMEQAYAVDHAETGETALYMAGINTYDVIILDVMIPSPDGLEVCRRLRSAKSTVPILMLTARDTVEDKIAGLDSGADDYLAKPFEFGELLARLRALLRRGGATQSATIRVGGLQIDTRSHREMIDGRPVTLTTKEYGVLEFLARNSGRIVTREEISEHVWNQDFDPFSNLIEVYINRLRRHIERVSGPKLIQTVRGAGYMLDAHAADQDDACSTPSGRG
jgi:DNA-binding response OmpR family regulator